MPPARSSPSPDKLVEDENPPHIGLARSDALSDEQILRIILRNIVTATRARAYCAIFVPQVGPRQGEPVEIGLGLGALPQAAKEYIDDAIDEFNLAATFEQIETIDLNGLYVTSAPISSEYDINLGIVLIVTPRSSARHALRYWLKIFEAIIAFRKEANALGFHGRFFRLDEQQREKLDRAIGRIVHRAIHPHQTMIYVQHDANKFRTSFISQARSHVPQPHYVSRGDNNLTNAHDRLQLKILNLGPQQAGSVSLPTGLESYALHHGYRSCMIVPVYSRRRCYCLIVCLFRRERAISSIEINIVKNMAALLSDYYRLWYRNHEVERNFAESDVILRQVRELLLMVDVLHDAAEDIATARGHLGVLNPKIPSEKETLKTTKNILDNLITATNHLKSFFRRREARDVSKFGIRFSQGFSPDNVDMQKLLSEIKLKYREHLHNNKIELDFKCPRSLRFRGIEMYIRRSIDNAVKNSVFHLAQKSHIRRAIQIGVHLGGSVSDLAEPDERFADRFMVVEVQDNGPGISADLLSSVRERYVSTRGGMGLGIPIMQGACEAHGGSLELSSIWGENFRAVLRYREMDGGR